MITIRFDSKFKIIHQVFNMIQFEMKKNTIRTALAATVLDSFTFMAYSLA